jgi:hypothetical protein
LLAVPNASLPLPSTEQLTEEAEIDQRLLTGRRLESSVASIGRVVAANERVP